MGNAVRAEKYRQRWEEIQRLIHPDNFEEQTDYQLTDEYIVCSKSYAGKVNDWNLRGCECSLFKGERNIATWSSIDDSAEIFKMIRHSDGVDYLIFRQDLYGYSVLNMDSGAMMQYFPESSLNGGETFIWTDVDYNPLSEVLAISGCYWACPNGVHLFAFDNPFSENSRYVDLLECFEGGYDRYDDMDFIKWSGSDMCIARYDVQTETKETVTITQNEYLKYLFEKGQIL